MASCGNNASYTPAPECVYPEGTLEITENGEFDVTQYALASVSVSGGGGGSGIGTLLVEESIGHIQTTSTSVVSVGSVTIPNYRDYNVFICTITASNPSANYHIGTVSIAFIYGNTLSPSSAVASNKVNAYLKWEDNAYVGQLTSPYGVYVTTLNASSGVLSISARYNSDYTHTIDDDYTVRVYGLTTRELFPSL